MDATTGRIEGRADGHALRGSEFRAFLIVLLLAFVFGCHSEDDNGPGSAQETHDLNTRGIPKFVGIDYIELPKIQRISKFRSGIGHDYWDDFEQCRSMKHYFEPKNLSPGSTITISSPVKGTVSRVFQEWAGTQVQIRTDAYPAFYVIIFHIQLSAPVNEGTRLDAGQILGTHIGTQTMSDIAVGVSTPTGWKLISWFDVMTDTLFRTYQSRGLNSRTDAIISKQNRDADTLHCSGDVFLNAGTLENWVTLN